MTHALLIASPPDSDTHRQATAFFEALTRIDVVSLVYFVGDAVAVMQPQHSKILNHWRKTAHDYQVQLWMCSGSMSTLPNCDIPTDIEIAGHASWVEASLKADKIFSFPA